MGRKQRVIAAAIILFLAIVILLAINPLEQIHQAQDRRVEAGVQEFLRAVEYYYKAFFEYPWEVLGQSNPSEAVVQSSWLQELIDKGAVDSKFAKHSSWRQIHITQDGIAVLACFDPISERFQKQADEQGKGRDGAVGCLSSCFNCLP